MGLGRGELTIETVRYSWPEYYTRVTTADGKVIHWGPWKSQWAADRCGILLAARFEREKR